MIFIKANVEEVVQVADKTRIDISQTFVSGDAITTLTIEPEAGAGAVNVFSTNPDNWYLDWAYSTDGDKTITIEAGDGTITETKVVTLSVVTEADDNLYSNDAQLFAIESELKRYLPPGRNSYLNIHRESQSRILNYLDRKRLWNENGTPYTKDQLNLTGELQKWSLYETALTIYNDLSISGGDKFKQKVDEYTALRNYERDRGALRIDKDASGTVDPGEFQDMKSFRMIRR